MDKVADIVILSARPEFWQQHLPAMRERGFAVLTATAPEQVEALAGPAATGRLRLAVVDLPYDFNSLGQSIRRIQAIQPGLPVAVISSLEGAELKEALAGQQVFLALPRTPGDLDIKLLLNKLQSLR